MLIEKNARQKVVKSVWAKKWLLHKSTDRKLSREEESAVKIKNIPAGSPYELAGNLTLLLFVGFTITE